MTKTTRFVWLTALLIMAGALYAQNTASNWKDLKGPYLGQKPPGTAPEIFAPGIVSTDYYNHSSITISNDGHEIYWAMGPLDHPRKIYVSKRLPDGWSEPQIVSFTKVHDGDCPVLSPDGRKMYFNSNRPLNPGGSMRERYWVVERAREGWSQPEPLGPEINGGHLHWQSSIDGQGNFYFGSAREGTKGKDDIFVAAMKNGKHARPVSMDPVINTDRHEGCPYISPDGAYMIFGRGGLHISFRKKDGTWTAAKNLGKAFERAICPYVSPDGKYLFYLVMGRGFNDVYWVDAAHIISRASTLR